MFKDGDIICFLGDSITASGLWMAESYQYLRKRYKIKCYNCGVAGSTAAKAFGYLYPECLVYNPDYVVIMFGMNDLGRTLYSPSLAYSEDVEQQKADRLKLHIESYEAIIKACVDFGSKVIICTPTPYDEITEQETEKLSFQQVLETAANHHLELAEKYGCAVVDFKSVLLSMLGERNVIGADRVHPTEEAYHIMAQVFLKDTGEIESCDFNTPFKFENWNRERFEAEQKFKILNYVELCDLYDDGYAKNKTVEEIKQIAKKRYEDWEDKTAFIPRAYLEYIKNGDLRNKLRGEVVKRTIF